jgi:hypothetical protein
VRQAEWPVAVAVIIGVVILIAAATSRTPRGISITLGVPNVSTPGTKALQSANFQQEAFTEYTAGVLTSKKHHPGHRHSVSCSTPRTASRPSSTSGKTAARRFKPATAGRGSIPCSDCQGCHH